MAEFIPVAYLDERIRALDADIARLSQERELLRSLRSRSVIVTPDGQTEKPRRTLTDTVFDFVLANPGLTGPEITDRLLGTGLVVGGADPRKTLSTTIGALVQKGRLRRDPATGQHFAP